MRLRAVRDGYGAIVDFEVVAVNVVACSYMRSTPQDLRGSRILDRLPATHSAALVTLFVDVVESGSPLERWDTPHPHEAEASERRYDVQGVRAGDGVAVTWRDVTERHAAQERVVAHEQLAAAEELFRLALDGAAIGMCLVAPDGRFLRANPALCEMLGREREELLACTWQELTHPDDLDVDLALVQDVLDGRRRSYRLLKRFVAADGRLIWGDLSAAAIRNADDSVRHFISQIVDVTERMAAERSLADREEMFRVVLDHTSDAIMRFGPDLRVVYVNQRLIDFTGITLENWLGKTFHEAGFPPHLTVPWDGHSRQVFATGEPVLHEFEARPARKAAEADLRDLATRDSLTGLANRAALIDEIARSLSAGQRTGRAGNDGPGQPVRAPVGGGQPARRH